MSKKITLRALAGKYSVSEKTIARWRNEGAPVLDPKAMTTWIAARKNIPKSCIGGGVNASGQNGTSTLEKVDIGPEGAQHALRRLEAEEAVAGGEYQLAKQGGEPLHIREKRKAWLEVNESLRKLDLAVEDRRRELGELMPREAIEKAVRFFIYGAYVEFNMLSSGLPNQLAGLDARTIGLELEKVLDFTWINGALMSSACCPDFLQPIISKEISDHYTVNADAIQRRVAVFQRALAIAESEDE